MLGACAAKQPDRTGFLPGSVDGCGIVSKGYRKRFGGPEKGQVRGNSLKVSRV
jgi:hypothetical protein